jgi:hypothetical protein
MNNLGSLTSFKASALSEGKIDSLVAGVGPGGSTASVSTTCDVTRAGMAVSSDVEEHTYSESFGYEGFTTTCSSDQR